MKKLLLIFSLIPLLYPPTSAATTGRSSALVIVGLGGDKAHYEVLVDAGTAIAESLRRVYGYGHNVTFLTEDGATKPGVDGFSDSAGIRAAIQAYINDASPQDRLLIVLIGHSSGEREHWRLNIPGGDISAADWQELLSVCPGTLGVVAAAPASAHLAKIISGPKRIVISSSRPNEIRTWAFLEALSEILGPGVEEDRPRPRNMWDLFELTEKGVKRAFESKGYMRNEHASIDDNGDGMGTEGLDKKGEDGKLARAFILSGSGGKAGNPTLVESKNTRAAETTDSEIRELAAGIDPKKFDAVILLHEEEGNINEDMTTRWRKRTVTKILAESGRERANIRLSLPPGVEADISRARTLLPDGRVIDADTHAIIKGMVLEGEPELIPGGGPHAPREIMLHLSEAVPGAILDVEIKIRAKNFDIQGDFFDDIFIQENIPVKRARVEIHFPKSLDLRILPAGLPGHIEISDAGRYAKTARWTADGLEAVPNEPLADPPYLRAGRLVITSIASWNEIARWYYFLSRPVLKADTEIKSLARRLTEKLDTPEEKIKAMYEWVSEEIRYVAIPLGVHGYKPHMVPNILKWRYGDCKDKASLLITLLREAQIRSYIVLIGAGMGDVVPDAPRPSAFNHAIVALPAEGGVQFLDPTAENAMFGTLPAMDQGRHALVVWGETGSLILTPFDPPESNALYVDRSIRIDANDLVVEETRASNGHWALERRGLIRHEGISNARVTLAAALSRYILGVRLESYEADELESINRPLKEILKYRIVGGAQGALMLPWEPTPLAGISTNEPRKSEISLGTTFLLSETTILSGIAAPNHESEIKNNAGGAGVSIQGINGQSMLRKWLVLSRPRLPAAEYPAITALAGVIPPGISRNIFVYANMPLIVILAAIALIACAAALVFYLRTKKHS